MPPGQGEATHQGKDTRKEGVRAEPPPTPTPAGRAAQERETRNGSEHCHPDSPEPTTFLRKPEDPAQAGSGGPADKEATSLGQPCLWGQGSQGAASTGRTFQRGGYLGHFFLWAVGTSRDNVKVPSLQPTAVLQMPPFLEPSTGAGTRGRGWSRGQQRGGRSQRGGSDVWEPVDRGEQALISLS